VPADRLTTAAAGRCLTPAANRAARAMWPAERAGWRWPRVLLVVLHCPSRPGLASALGLGTASHVWAAGAVPNPAQSCEARRLGNELDRDALARCALPGGTLRLPHEGEPCTCVRALTRFWQATLGATALDPVRGRSVGRCAIVSSADSLSGSGYGREIDAHAQVVRINFPPPARAYERDVGTRTTLMFANFGLFAGQAPRPAKPGRAGIQALIARGFAHKLDLFRRLRLEAHRLSAPGSEEPPPLPVVAADMCAKCKQTNLACAASCAGGACAAMQACSQVPGLSCALLSTSVLKNSWATYAQDLEHKPGAGWTAMFWLNATCDRVTAYGFSTHSAGQHYYAAEDVLVTPKTYFI
jgi:hypothetical protein